MSDKQILKLLRSKKPHFLELLCGEIKSFQSAPPELKMEFKVVEDFCHTGGKIVQGGFVTVMLDSPMAHLAMALLDFKINPMTLDINISFIEPSHPGKLESVSRVIKLGKSTGFLASNLYQEGSLVATATSTVKLVPMVKI